MRKRLLFSSALIFLLALSRIPGFGQEGSTSGSLTAAAVQNTDQLLTLHTPIRGEVAFGQLQSFHFETTHGQYGRIAIKPQGSPLKVEFVAPDGKVVYDQTLPEGTIDRERISVIAETAGSYVLRLSVLVNRKTITRFVVELEDLRASVAADQKRIAAEGFSVEARLAVARRTADGLRIALQKYGEALTIWTELGEEREQAETLLSTGRILHNLSRPKEALDNYRRSLALWRAIGDRWKEAEALSAMGWTYGNLGDPDSALGYYLQALPIRREVNDLRGQAQTLTTIGQSYVATGDPQKAIEYYSESLPLARQAGDKIQEAFALTSFARLYNSIDEYQKALDHIELSIPIWIETGQRFGEADALNTKGIIYGRLGDSDKAIAYFERSVELSRLLGNRSLEADALGNIGIEYWRLSKYREFVQSLHKSIDYLNRALAIRQAIGQKQQTAESLGSLGLVYETLGELDKGLDYFNQSLAMDGRRVTSIHNIGLTYYVQKDYSKAIQLCSEALGKFREQGDRIGEANALRVIALSQMSLGNLDDGLSKSGEALAIIEAGRTKTLGTEARTSFGIENESYFSTHVNILRRMHRQRPSQGYDIKALETTERGRQRGLLDLLSEAHVDIREGVDPTLLDREKVLERELNAKENYRLRLTSSKAGADKIADLQREIGSLMTEYQELRDRIRVTSPRYASLTQPSPLGAKQIQQLLDSDTIILDYWLTNTEASLWLISPESISMYSLPGSRVLLEAEERLYRLLTARNQHIADETAEQRASRIAKADVEYCDVAARLSQMMLGPVASELGHKRLVIIGAPWTAFEVLPSPRRDAATAEKATGRSVAEPRNTLASNYRPLIADHEIVRIPSASVLAALRRGATTRQSFASGVAIIADPVFASDDPRVKTSERASSSNTSPTVRRSSSIAAIPAEGIDPKATMFRRLRFSREEADAISSMASRSRSFEAIDFAANKDVLKRESFSQRSIIHFATHTVLNYERPDLSGIVLSLVDDYGNPLDGFLRLHEIYNLRLNSGLVVLSACNSASGSGDDMNLVGLTTGFMYAGAPRVIASLWSVDDRATAELMKRFYKAMLIDGMRPAAALRTAQIQMLGEKGWGAPYFWAAFTLQGEWR